MLELNCALKGIGGWTCHGSDALAAVVSLDAATAVAGSVPVRVADGRAEKTLGQGVGAEGASAALDIAAVERSLAREGAADDGTLVERDAWGDSCESRDGDKSQSGEVLDGEHLGVQAGCDLFLRKEWNEFGSV